MSYFDGSTQGGQLIFEFYHDASPSTAADRYFQYILQPGYQTVCQRQAYSMKCALEASASLIKIRKTQLHKDYVMLSASSSGSGIAAAASRGNARNDDRTTFAASAVPTIHDPTSRSLLANAPPEAVKLFTSQSWALEQAELLWQWVDFIAHESLRILDTTTNDVKPSVVVYPDELTPKIAREIAQTILVETWPPKIIARYFGFRSMEDVKKLEGKRVMYTILNNIQGYCKNPHFKVNIARLKKMGILSQTFDSTKVCDSPYVSVSTLRWLLMFYLEIPGFDEKKNSTFRLEKYEDRHSPDWKTVPNSNRPSRSEGGTYIPAAPSDPSIQATVRRVSDVSSPKSNGSILHSASPVVGAPILHPMTTDGNGHSNGGRDFGTRPVELVSAASETGTLARVVTACGGTIGGKGTVLPGHHLSDSLAVKDSEISQAMARSPTW